MRLPEDEPFYMRRNLWGAIKQHSPAELTEASRATLIQQIATQAPATTYLAGGQISIESLANLIDEIIAKLTKEDTEGS